ncbi:nucleotide-diphospho-sugar transferases [Lucifera butyrica]|uniref:Nucleotide-diphospho-sugar transferases n=1 Tax=Lucifera butyrica TaxID=1351585 RepID=A0A498R3F4_9FIRM|nr:polyprenol monophosphomannose synthase [Lucifera butyrica]VBB05934.1 nucleotide-diphospho-sugar transferases [Lucifera butyrica]
MMQLVIVPTYNERDNLGELLEGIYKAVADMHVLVVDDNSPDGTGKLASYLMNTRYKGSLFLIERTGKLGLGTAYLAGFKWALERKYQYIFEMDGDLSHNPRHLPSFLQAVKECDLVLGSRYVSGGGVRNWSLLRRLISRGGSLYSRFILGLPFQDLTGGFKCFRREVLEQINLAEIKSNGYSFQIEMTYRAFLKGFRIKEVPIVFEERLTGHSKMSYRIFAEAIVMVWKLRLDRKRLKAGTDTAQAAPPLP